MLSTVNTLTKSVHKLSVQFTKQCHSVFGLQKLIEKEKPDHFKVTILPKNQQVDAVKLIKKYYFSEHVFVKSRRMCLEDNHALDEYLYGLLKQGNCLYAKAEDDSLAGLSVNFASTSVDPNNLRNFAYYRQDPNVKDLLCFLAKLEETPNLWKVFNKSKIFEIKMLLVLPEFRRQGLATLLVQKSMTLARDQAYNVVRMNCINEYDYKVAEGCMMQCIARFSIHKLRSTTAPYIKRNSEYNKILRVYVDVMDTDNKCGDKTCTLSEPIQMCKMNLEECLE